MGLFLIWSAVLGYVDHQAVSDFDGDARLEPILLCTVLVGILDSQPDRHDCLTLVITGRIDRGAVEGSEELDAIFVKETVADHAASHN